MRVFATSLALAVGALALGTPVDAAETAGGSTFVASTETDSISGRAVAREVVSVNRERERAFVTVGDGSGAALTLPTTFAADGEIEANGNDPAIACYNSALALLAARRATGAPSGAVFVNFPAGVVRVPVALRRASPAGALATYVGTGIESFSVPGDATTLHVVVDANIDANAADVERATLVSTTSIAGSNQPLKRTTCSLERESAPVPALPA